MIYVQGYSVIRGHDLKVERNRITLSILIDSKSGGFLGVSPPQNPERLILLKIVTIKGMKSHTRGGSKLVGKTGQFSTGIFKAVHLLKIK